MSTVQVEKHLLLSAARMLRGQANVLDVSTPPAAYSAVEGQITEMRDLARRLEVAADRNQAVRR